MSLNKSNSGLLLTDTSELLAEVKQVFKTAFPDLNVDDPSLPQGQIISFITELYRNAQLSLLEAFNIFTYGGSGKYLDTRNYTLLNLLRKAASFSTVEVTIYGRANTVVPTTFIVANQNNKWQITAAALISETGSTIATFKCLDAGAIQADVGSINKIQTNVIGVEKVYNASAANVGVAEESDSDFWTRATKSIQTNYAGLFSNGLSQLMSLQGVTKVGGYENISNAIVTVKNYKMPAHSVSYIVLGGDSAEIGRSLLKNKNPGCAMGGNKTVDIVDEVSGQLYKLTYYEPINVPIYIEATIKPELLDNRDYQKLIYDAVKPVVDALQFGDVVYPGALLNKIANIGINITGLRVSRETLITSWTPVDLEFIEYASIAKENIEIIKL